jgi:hypothetical protein
VLYHLGHTASPYPIVGGGLPAFLFDIDAVHDRWDAAPLWSTTLPSAVCAVLICTQLWRRRATAAVLAGAGVLALTTVYFSRSFTPTYWWLPFTLCCLAVLMPWPDERAGAVDGLDLDLDTRVREPVGAGTSPPA